MQVRRRFRVPLHLPPRSRMYWSADLSRMLDFPGTHTISMRYATDALLAGHSVLYAIHRARRAVPDVNCTMLEACLLWYLREPWER